MKEIIRVYVVAVGTLLLLALLNLLIWNHMIKLGLPKISYLDSLGFMLLSNTLFKNKREN